MALMGEDYSSSRLTIHVVCTDGLAQGRHLATIRDKGKIYTACRDGQIPFISGVDMAAVAFHALTDQTTQKAAPVRGCGITDSRSRTSPTRADTEQTAQGVAENSTNPSDWMHSWNRTRQFGVLESCNHE